MGQPPADNRWLLVRFVQNATQPLHHCNHCILRVRQDSQKCDGCYIWNYEEMSSTNAAVQTSHKLEYDHSFTREPPGRERPGGEGLGGGRNGRGAWRRGARIQSLRRHFRLFRQLPHLANGDNGHALATSDTKTRHAQVVEILSRGQLGVAHVPPARFQKTGPSPLLQRLCSNGSRETSRFRVSTAVTPLTPRPKEYTESVSRSHCCNASHSPPQDTAPSRLSVPGGVTQP